MTMSCFKPVEVEVREEAKKEVLYDGSLKIFADGTLQYTSGKLLFDISAGQMRDASTDVFSSEAGQMDHRFSEDKLEVVQSWQNGARLETIAQVTDNRLDVVQNAKNHQGISSVSFQLVVSDDYEILIPVWGGIRLSKHMPDIHLGFQRLSYPNLWQAQMFLIQGKTGGLLIHADDNGTQFKALTVKHSNGSFKITIETIPQAPFDSRSTFESVHWNAVCYQGNWEQGALIYKEYVDKTFNLSVIDALKPSWANDIGLVVLTDIEDSSLLYELAATVEPTKTLLHIPGWRKQPYDLGYPDYTPNSNIQERIKLAKRLGFRVGLHFNMIGADDTSSEYQAKLIDAHSLDEFSKAPIYERYVAGGQTITIAQINQASRAWREMMVRKVREVVQHLEVDVIHLDQSLLCFNDGRGLIEGMTSMQGNVEMQKDLAEALPKVAFSGEGINEMNLRYASLLQMHVYGLNSGDRSWDIARFRQIVPMAALIFGDAMSIYHYPAMPNPATAPDYFAAWHNAGFRMGLIPTIMRMRGNQIDLPNAITKQILLEAKWTQENLPKIYQGSWERGIPLMLELKSGRVCIFRDVNGSLVLSN